MHASRTFVWAGISILLLAALAPLPRAHAEPPAIRPFKIQVVDEQTGRGVPLVELQTTSQVRCVTDSNGVVAFYEPALMNQPVFFFVRSHGYQFPKDGFGMEGKTLDVREGGEAVLKIKRVNIAERLYRITGEGIYRDTVMVGEKAPLEQPLLNGQVVGQDSTLATVYRGKIYWFWGDTARPRYPLGHFQTAGATSLLPGQGGLPPGVGVNLHYFTDADGFSKKMAPLVADTDEPLLVWIDGVMTLPDATGRERLVAHYAKMKDLGTMREHGLIVYNDDKEVFEKAAVFDVKEPWRFLRGHPIRVMENGVEYRIFQAPFPNVRVRAEMEAIKTPSRYEAFTPLVPGSRYDKATARVERDAAGKALWGWKADTDPITQSQERELIAAGKLQPDEAHFQLRDADTGEAVQLHGGSFYWNDYLKKWIMIGLQVGGKSSLIGEVWFAAADSPTGPWGPARKIVTHNKYSFYNPTQHPFFDEQGGKIIYFEGTYASTFSGNEYPTPHYDYNPMMYRLDLSDPRLQLP